MKNIETKISDKNILTITVDLNKEFGQSASGKSTIIATTAGNQEVKDGMKFGLNVYKSAK